MSAKQESSFQYARDDFRYPNWLTKILDKLVGKGADVVKNAGLDRSKVELILWALGGLYFILILLGNYFIGGLLIGLWVYLSQVHLRLFIDQKAPNRHLQHVLMEAPFVVGLAIHFFTLGYLFTGIATLLGFVGLYLLSAMQMKYDLASIKIPKLYYLRWDRLGMLAIMVILGAISRPRAYLWPVLGGWFLFALTFYDYFWVIIQFMKNGKK